MNQYLLAAKLLWTVWRGSNLRQRVRSRIADRVATTPQSIAALVPQEEAEDFSDPVSPVPPQPTPEPPASPEAKEPLIIETFRRLGYRLHEDGRWNTYAIRNSAPAFDRYRCLIGMARYTNGKWETREWPGTTYPGQRYTVDKLLNPRGVAILQEGQYLDTYRLRRHRGIYQALCQDGGAVQVYRDGNRDRVYDLDAVTLDHGYFGINIHAPVNPDTGARPPAADRIGAASAGCIVFAGAQDFADAREEWRADFREHGNSFDFTLVSDVDLDFQFGTGAADMPDEPGQIAIPGTWYPETTRSTPGIRNRNILNVKQGGVPWNYSTGRDGRGHAIFPSFPPGIRAAIITLRSYWTRHELRTVADILARWAPVTDTIGSLPDAPPNAPADYARFVANRLGINPTDKLMTFRENGQVRSPDQLYALVAAMAEYENFTGLDLPRWVFQAGLDIV